MSNQKEAIIKFLRNRVGKRALSATPTGSCGGDEQAIKNGLAVRFPHPAVA
jgi:hypothetical protein